VAQRFFHGGTPEIIFPFLRSLYLWKRLQVRKNRGSCQSRRLLQYCQLLDRRSRDISRYLYLELFAVFRSFYLFVPQFLAETFTMLCGTLGAKHCVDALLTPYYRKQHVSLISRIVLEDDFFRHALYSIMLIITQYSMLILWLTLYLLHS
jgi:hypothetical protein